MLEMITEAVKRFYEENIQQHEKHDGLRTIEEVIEHRGFICEVHELSMISGHTLVIHRIINPLVTGFKKPILLQHGLGSHAAHWVINSEDGRATTVPEVPLARDKVDDSLGFALSNAGYDVWMGNIRGSKYGLKHDKFNAQDPEFWDLSFDDIVEQDLPLMIEHILKISNSKTLGYIGVSQGTTFMLALLASVPEYNDIILPFVAMAPVATTHNICNQVPVPIKEVVMKPFIEYLLKNPGPVVPLDSMKYVEKLFVGHRFEELTNKVTNFFNTTFTVQQLNGKRYHVITAHAGFHISRKNLAQSLQIHLANKLQKMDYGREANLLKYGTTRPPEYFLENITNKYISIIYCKRDDWVREEDLKTLKSRLSVPLFHEHKVQNRKWNHLDFQLGARSGYYVNAIVLDILRAVEQGKRVESG